MRLAAVLVLMAACGDNRADAIEVLGTPALVSVRTDDGGWASEPPIAATAERTTYRLPAGDSYDVMVVCAFRDGSFTAVEQRGAVDQLASPDCREDPLGFSELSGTVRSTDAVDVSAWDSVFSFVPLDPAYAFTVSAKKVDVIVSSGRWEGTGHVRILRDQDLRADLVEPEIDLDEETALDSLQVDQDPVDPDEHVEQWASWLTTKGGSSEVWFTNPGTVQVVPQSALADGDDDDLVVYAGAASGYRGFSSTLGPGFAGRVSWTPRLAGVTVDRQLLRAAWTPTDPAYTNVTFACSSRDAANDFLVTESVDWAKAHDETHIAFDRDVPGWSSAWVIEASDCNFRSYEADASTMRWSYVDLPSSAAIAATSSGRGANDAADATLATRNLSRSIISAGAPSSHNRR